MFSIRNIIHFVGIGLAIYFTYLMFLITLQYIPIDFEAAFLALKIEEVKLPYYRIAFFSHVYTSILVMFLGFFQFSKNLRNKSPLVHRYIGLSYALLILIISAPSGFIMGYHGNGGFYAQLSFCIQAILWFYFTGMAILKIKQRNIVAHQNYMILSFALTLSAISLRLFKWIIVNIWALPPMDTYKIVVWLGWLFNIGIASLLILYGQKRSSKH